MKPQIMGLRVASIVFGLMMLAQLARLLLRPEVIVQGHLMPLWPSMLAVVFLGLLCGWLWSLSVVRSQEKTSRNHG
jgi:membrane protease YdiL (CAAX protease family)